MNTIYMSSRCRGLWPLRCGRRASRRRQAAEGIPSTVFPMCVTEAPQQNQLLENKQTLQFADLVVMAGPLTPVPIPNTAVKCPSADGTLS